MNRLKYFSKAILLLFCLFFNRILIQGTVVFNLQYNNALCKYHLFFTICFLLKNEDI